MFAGQLKDLPLGLDDSCALHLLVLAHDAGDVCLVFLDCRSELWSNVLCRVDLEGVLGLAHRERESGLRDGKQYVPDVQNSASPWSLT